MGLFDAPTMGEPQTNALTGEEEPAQPQYDGSTSNVAYGLDFHAANADQPSLWDNFSDVVTKGVPLTALAAVNSFVNTGIEVGNALGYTDATKIDSQEQANDLGEMISPGSGPAYSQYYAEHAQGIEGAGLIVGSLVPGLGAIKGYKLATSAALDAYTLASETGDVSNILSRATGLLPSVQKATIIKGVESDIFNADAIGNTFNTEKYKAIAFGAGDQALQALVYQVATDATMHASPLLDDKSLGDLTSDAFYGTLAGAGIGSIIDGIATRGIFKRILNNADFSTKAQQISKDLGLGDYAAGDKVNTIINNMWDRPVATSGAGSVLAKLSDDRGTLAAKKALGTLSDPGNEDVTNGLFDTIKQMADSGGVTKDDAYNTFASLGKVQRLTDETIPKDLSDGTFYVNKRGSTAGANDLHWSDLITDQSTPLADINLRYRMIPGAADVPKIAGHLDTFRDVNGAPQLLYSNAAEAWNDGVDIFVNKKGDAIVNPDAPNIMPVPKPGESRTLSQAEELMYRATGKLPLTKAGTQPSPLLGSAAVNTADKPGAAILNFKTGAITDKAIPIVGDYGPVAFKRGALQYGDKTYPFNVSDSIDTGTSPIDANARFVAAGLRGIQKGDSIASEDAPMLEALYNDSIAQPLPFGQRMAALSKQGVTIDGDLLPDTPQQLLDMIRDAKDNQISSDIASGANADEAALKSNVPISYIRNGFKAQSPADYLQDTTQFHQANHALLWYNIGDLNTQNGQLLRGIQDTMYRVQLVKAANKDAAAAWFGKAADNFNIKGNAADVGIAGAPGGGFLASSRAAYDSIGSQFERVGRFIQGKNSDDMQIVHNTLQPAANALRADPQAAAEANMFTAVRHRTGENFTFMPPELEAKYLPTIGGDSGPTGRVAILTSSLTKADDGTVSWNGSYIPKGFVDASKIADASLPRNTEGLRNYYVLSPKVADWETANMQVNDNRVLARNSFSAANGIQRNVPTGNLYAPPVDTRKYPFFAYLKARLGTGGADDSVHVITASSAYGLQSKISQFADRYSVYTKTGQASLKEYHEVEGDYQYNRNFADNRISADMARSGILNDITPGTRAENLIQDTLDWHQRQVVGLNRDYTELANGQLFAEIRGMGDRFASAESSQTGFVPTGLWRQAQNPYQNYINTALGISAKEQYKTWNYAQEVLESTFSSAFNAFKSGFQSARKGIIPYEKAADLAESLGLGKVYENATNVLKNYYEVANKLPEARSLSQFVKSANGIMGTGIIRLDAYQQLIHAISTPMLSAVEATSVKSGLAKQLVTELPDGSGRMIPATSKLLFQNIKDWFDPAIKAKYGDLFDAAGANQSVMDLHRQLTDELRLPWGDGRTGDLVAKIKNAADIGARLTGSNWVNRFNHFFAANTGRQIFEAAGQSGQELQDNVLNFTNRVMGNYTAGQRPVAFQGPLGQAVGLFQTFYFNMMQNVFHYVENGEGKTLATLGGLQTSLFGLNSLPGFQAINNHIVGNASGNTNHDDLYSGVASVLGAGRGTLGNYLLYGAPSNWLDAGLYNRGDINPRQLTLLPVNPLQFPAIKGTINIIGNLINVEENIRQGAPIGASLMLGLEHNGLNRPLAGIAQMAQGFSTNSAGDKLISSNTMGLSDMFSAATFSRLLGARPLDEAVAMDTMYRSQLYTAKDQARIHSIGDAAKLAMMSGSQLSGDEINAFASKYAASGGNINKFNSTVMRWTGEAHSAVANKVFESLKGSAGAKNAMMEMGGMPLPDYRYNPIAPAPLDSGVSDQGASSGQ